MISERKICQSTEDIQKLLTSDEKFRSLSPGLKVFPHSMQFTTSCNQKAQWSPAVKLIVWYTRLGLLCKYTWCCYIHSTKSQITKQHEFKPSPPSSRSRPIWRRLHRKKANHLKQLKHLLKRELHLNQRPQRHLPARITQKFPKE